MSHGMYISGMRKKIVNPWLCFKSPKKKIED